MKPVETKKEKVQVNGEHNWDRSRYLTTSLAEQQKRNLWTVRKSMLTTPLYKSLGIEKNKTKHLSHIEKG